MKMGVEIKPEYLEDRAIFNYFIKQMSGVSDERGSHVVLYSEVINLPGVPNKAENEVLLTYDVPSIKGKIAFIDHTWVEDRTRGCMSELKGPFYQP